MVPRLDELIPDATVARHPDTMIQRGRTSGGGRLTLGRRSNGYTCLNSMSRVTWAA